MMKVLRCLLACAVAFPLLMVAAYAIPSSAIMVHVRQSAHILAEDEYDHKMLVDGIYATELDNYSTALMLNLAVHGSGPADALRNPYHRASSSGPDAQQIDSLLESVAADATGANAAYPRYWHGYLLPLKILLIAFDLNEVRVCLEVVGACLLVACCILLCKVRSIAPTLVFAAAFVLVGMPIALLSLSLATSWIVALATCLVILLREASSTATLDDMASWSYLFCIVGATTTFVDLLCTPLVTFGVPAVLVAYLNAGSADRRLVFKLLLLAISWLAGYALLWAWKWVLASLLTDANVISDALSQVMVRSGASGGESQVLAALVDNVSALVISKYVLALAVLAVVAFLACVAWRYRGHGAGMGKHARDAGFANRGRDEGSRVYSVAVLLCMALLPFLWYVVLSEHSAVHFWFTYRSQIVSLMAVGFAACALLGLTRPSYLKKSR